MTQPTSPALLRHAAALALAVLALLPVPAAAQSAAGDSARARPGASGGAPRAAADTAADSAARAAQLPPGWPVKGPAPLPGSILPERRIVAFYGNPLSKRMGILGEIAPDDMLRK